MVRRFFILSFATTLSCALSSCDAASAAGKKKAGEESTSTSTSSSALQGLSPQFDFVSHTHWADVYRGGLYIDFGTPARRKYTMGNWKNGWGRDINANNITSSYVGTTGRVFFHVDEAKPLRLRFRLKPIGTQMMSLYLNQRQLETVQLNRGNDFADYDAQVPGEAVKPGENHLLLRFGGETVLGQEHVSVAMDSIRVVAGDAIQDTEAPVYSSLTSEVTHSGAKKKALITAAGTELRYYVQVPANGKLGFTFNGEGGARAKIRVKPEAGTVREILSETPGASWSSRAISLQEYAGKIVEVAVASEGAGTVRWSELGVFAAENRKAPSSKTAKNVVVLLIDTLRADKLKPFNSNTRVRTPVIDEIARDGTVFQSAQAPENWTKPSVASVLTSLYPETHGTKGDESKLPAAALMLSEHLKANGFATGSFIANGYVSDKFGFDQGWDHYTNYIRESKKNQAEQVFREAGEWIEQNKDKRFFAYIHTIDPHVPYDPPEEFVRMYDDREYAGQVRPRMTADLVEKAKRTPPAITFDASDQKRLMALYDGEISYHDHHLGLFVEKMKQLGLWDQTIFVVTSDHGEEFNDHGKWGHGHSVYQELLHVPLAFRFPGVVPAQRSISEVVSTVDVAPTVVAALGVRAMPAAEGRSLIPVFAGRPVRSPAVAFSDFLDTHRVVRAGSWKLILRGYVPTLFDLERDPGEQREASPASHPIAMRYCRIAIGQFLGSTNRAQWTEANQSENNRSLGAEGAEIDETLRNQLRALGYAN